MFFDLSRFPSSQMIACGAELRRSGEGAASMEEAAGALSEVFFERFKDAEGEPTFALTRVYRTLPFYRAPAVLQDKVREMLGEEPDPKMKCLALLSSRGLEDPWNHRDQSEGHQIIPLKSVEFVSSIPMLANLFQSLGINMDDFLGEGGLLMHNKGKIFNVFHVEEAVGSPYIPAQDGFVVPFGVKSVIGFGGVLPDGELYVTIHFSRVHISRAVAERFNTLTLHARVPVARFPFGPSFNGEEKDCGEYSPEEAERRALEMRLEVLEDLLAEHEEQVHLQALMVEERNAQMRLIMDNINQGLVTLDEHGLLKAECSAVVQEWFGEVKGDTPFWSFLEEHDPRGAEWFEMGWEGLADGFLPLELCLEQLPDRFQVEDKVFEVSYAPVLKPCGEVIECLVLVITDITLKLSQAAAESKQRERVSLFSQMVRDRSNTQDFFQEVEKLLKHASDPDASTTIRLRALHTLKGNFGFFEQSSMSRFCHELEEDYEEHRVLSQEGIEELLSQWQERRNWLKEAMGDLGGQIELDRGDYLDLLKGLRGKLDYRELEGIVFDWVNTPASSYAERMERQAQALAQKLGRGEIVFESQVGKLRMEPQRWGAFWASMAHVLRNAVDHGLEMPEERKSLGKSPQGKIVLRIREKEGYTVIELCDDGRGVDWDRIKAKAEVAGLPHETKRDLLKALLSDGISSRDEVSETSGRGVGMSALASVVEQMKGKIGLISKPGQGTVWRFSIPTAQKGSHTQTYRRLTHLSSTVWSAR